MAWSKIDDAIAAADECASSAIPLAVRRNLAANVDDRSIASAHAFDGAAGLGLPPTWSTHPDHWFIVPLLIPAVRGQTTLTCAVGYACTDQDVDVSLSVEGAEGSTVTVSAAASGVVEVSCDLPDGSANGVWRGALRFKSHASGAETIACDVYEVDDGRIGFDPASSPGSGRTHWLFVHDTPWSGGSGYESTRYYMGRIESSAGTLAASSDLGWVWPRGGGVTNPGADAGSKGTGGLWQLGQITVYGYALWTSGDAGTWPLPNPDAYRAGRTVRAYDVLGMDAALRMMHRERSWWIGCGPVPTSLYRYGGFTGDLSSRAVAAAYHPVRANQTGVDVALLWAYAPNSTATDVTWDIQQSDEDGTGATSVEVSQRGAALPFRDQPGDPGIMTRPGLVHSGSKWGAGDLLLDGDELRLNMLQPTQVTSAGLSAGAYALTAVETSATSDDVWVAAAMIRERTI